MGFGVFFAVSVVMCACTSGGAGVAADVGEAGSANRDANGPPSTGDASVLGPEASAQRPSETLGGADAIMAYAGPAPSRLDDINGVWEASVPAFLAGPFPIRIVVRPTQLLVAATCDGTSRVAVGAFNKTEANERYRRLQGSSGETSKRCQNVAVR